MRTDRHLRHAAMIGFKNDGGRGEVTKGVASFKEDMRLADDRILDVVPEVWWKGGDLGIEAVPTACMQTIFPSLIIQHNVNSISTRQIVPRGVGSFDFVWTHFGFADDTPEMTRRRLRQANLFGPAGLVSADDGEVIELSQVGFSQHGDYQTIAELGGRSTGNTDHMVTETLIRGMYAYYRKVMEI
jgi:salicylate 5-hydroxylase large subunit